MSAALSSPAFGNVSSSHCSYSEQSCLDPPSWLWSAVCSGLGQLWRSAVTWISQFFSPHMLINKHLIQDHSCKLDGSQELKSCMLWNCAFNKKFCCANLRSDSTPSLLFFSLHLHAVCDFSLLSFHNFYNDLVLFQLKSKLFMHYFVCFQVTNDINILNMDFLNIT